MTTESKAYQKYLTSNDTDINWGLICTTIGYQDVPRNSRYPLLQHPSDYNFHKERGRILNEYQLLYIVEGQGYFQSSSYKKTKVTAGTIIFLFPGEWHSYYPDPETGWKEYWVGFSGPAVKTIIDGGFFSKTDPMFLYGFSSTLIEKYNEINQAIQKEKSGFQQYISGIVMNMLGFVYYKHKNAEFKDNPITDKINQSRNIMKERLSENISPVDIAKELGLGYTWFRRTFKEYVGSSPGQYQLQLKHLRAKELLNDEHISISDVCYQLGFENISQFSSFFKKHEGISASEYRRNMISANEIN